MIRALRRSLGWQFARGMFPKLVHDSSLFVEPLLLHALVSYLSDHEEGNEPPAYHGYALAFGFLAAKALQSLMIHQYFGIAFRTGMNVCMG